MSDPITPTGPVLPPATPDLAERYTTERSEATRRESDADAWFDSFTSSGPRTPPATPAAGGPTPPETPAGEPVDPFQAWIGNTLRAGQNVLGFQRAANRAAVTTGREVVHSAVETPGSIYRGATGAVEQVFKTGDELATWLNSNVVDLTVGDKAKALGENNPALWLADKAGTAKQLFAAPETGAGKAVEFVSQWLTSAGLAGNLAKASGMPINAYTKYVKDFAAGVIGFDPKDKRLANLIDDAAPNPLTDFLKAKDEDPALLGRLKTGLETAGLSVVADGVIGAVRYLRAARAAAQEAKPGPWGARNGAPAPVVAKDSAVEAATARAVKAGNELDLPAVQISDDMAEKAARFLAGKSDDAPVQVNLERFEGPEQIKEAIGNLSKMLPKPETIPMERTLQAAREMGMTPQQLDEGLSAGLFDRRQISAGWMLFRSSAGKLVELADKAKATGAPADLARFNAAFQTSYGILQTVKGQSAEIARALQIHNALRKSEPDMVKGLTKLLDEGGGPGVALDMAEKVALLKDPGQAAQFVAAAGQATTRDQITHAWANILLSNPQSHVANVLDTTLSTLAQVPETWFASKFGSDVAKGEATARLYGIVQGMKDGVRLAARAMQTGQSSFTTGTRVETSLSPLASSSDLIQGGSGKLAGDYLKMLLPTRLMMAGDELTRTMNHRGEMHALAWREAAKNGLEGVEAARHAAKLMQEAPEWLVRQAEAQAAKGTFNEPLQGVAAGIAQVVDRANVGAVPIGRIIMPFVRTPTNLLRWTFHRTPAAFLSPHVQAEIAAGGATRDLALARIATGSTVMASFADLTMAGRITGAGPKDPELRANLQRTGWQPYSVKVGDKWYGYNRSGTFGSLIGIAADATELIGGVYTRDSKTIDIDGIPIEDSVGASVVLPFAGAIVSKQYMSGLAQAIDALSDPNRYGDKWLQRLAGSVVPAGIGAVERTVDPEIRRAEGWMDAVRARIPGMSDSLPPRLNLWGEKIKDQNGIYNLFLPVRVSQAGSHPIDNEIARLRLEISPPAQVQSFNRNGARVAVELTPEQHNRMIELAGNEIKVPPATGREPLGARDTLNAIVTGRHPLSRTWERASDEKRGLMVRDVVLQFREAARAEMLKENPRLRETVETRMREQGKALRDPREQGAGLSPAEIDRAIENGPPYPPQPASGRQTLTRQTANNSAGVVFR